jgi:sulfur carrier protein
MIIRVNGKPAELSGEINVTGMLEELKVTDPLYVTVQLNGEILKTADFPSVTVKENDTVEFLYFMGGGAGSGRHPC